MYISSEYANLTLIKQGKRTIIYRGYSKTNQKFFILKLIKNPYPTFEETTRLKREFEISKSLNSPYIVRPIALEQHQSNLVLVLEDFGGQSLKRQIPESGFELLLFLQLSLQITRAIAEIHQQHIIHKDINPHNIILNAETGQLKLTDFSIASCFPQGGQVVNATGGLEGTLSYISPEQTGRLSQVIDYHTDFYSLGVTFYEMLTGQLPFRSEDTLELIHAHIAKVPSTPHQLQPQIPQAVSKIVMKLLAKQAEDRYQSADGLQADLEFCLEQFQSQGKILNFIPGQRDRSSRLMLPGKLYGRELEIGMLNAALERVSYGQSELILLSGEAGIGKSSLVTAIQQPLSRHQGLFASGKFDQYQRNIPFAGLIPAFQGLIQQVLTESETGLEQWKEQLSEALGSNGQVMIDLIPELELIVGSQPPLPQVSTTESKQRFNQVVQQFVYAFARQNRPLVLLLDDLQWADSASLKLIQALMTAVDQRHLLLICAYRDGEIGPTHPLVRTVTELEESGAVLHMLKLNPLTLAEVTLLVADTLHESVRSPSLAKVIFNRTQGNPFFIRQLLHSLYQEKLLTYDSQTGQWQWNLEQIQAVGVTDTTVLDLLIRSVRRLPESTQQALTLAACIGNQFDLEVLAVIHKKSPTDTAQDLEQALLMGLILPLTQVYTESTVAPAETTADLPNITYKFLHDRVQQAAYSLIPPEQRQHIHLTVGQLLLQHIPVEEREEQIFEIVNPLNLSAALLPDRTARLELADLNLIAAGKAKQATAYELAFQYLQMGLSLLAEENWQTHYDLTLALFTEAVEVAYLNTGFEQAELWAAVVLAQAKTTLDKLPIYETQARFQMAQGHVDQAIATILHALKALGINLPHSPTNQHILWELASTHLQIGRRSPKDLADLPEMTNPAQLAAMRLLISALPATFVSAPQLFPLIVLRMVQLCLKHGNSAISAYAYCQYGLILSGVLGDTAKGYQFGQLGLSILERFEAHELRPKVGMVFNAFIRPWQESLHEATTTLLDVLQTALNIGDLEYAGGTTSFYCGYLFFTGQPLVAVAEQQTAYLELAKHYKWDVLLGQIQIWRQLSLNLLGESQDPHALVSEEVDEHQLLPQLQAERNYMAVAAVLTAKVTLCYLLRDYAGAVYHAETFQPYQKNVPGLLYVAETNFYYSLALLGRCHEVRDRRPLLRQVQRNQRQMARWAQHAPMNFRHKYDLVQAELARVRQQFSAAIALYDTAIQTAREQGYPQEEALAHELAGEFHQAQGRVKLGQFYLLEAYRGYSSWGAQIKLTDLETRHPSLLDHLLLGDNALPETTRSTTTSRNRLGSGSLDLNTVMKALQAISGEIVLQRLLDQLMNILIENAGAERGLLFLRQDKQLRLAVEGWADQDNVVRQSAVPLTECDRLPLSILNYVDRTQENIVLNQATQEGPFVQDGYVQEYQPQSVLCTGITHKGNQVGVLYLENCLAAGAFTPARLEMIRLLTSQVAISLENAQLYASQVAVSEENAQLCVQLEHTTEKLKEANQQLERYSRTLEQKVAERTLELQEKNTRLNTQAAELAEAFEHLQRTQTQLVQSEKMSSLGQLVAGVAHEINNPVNFIYGNLDYAENYVQDLLHLIKLYQTEYPKPSATLQQAMEQVELDFITEDLHKLLGSMRVGAERIREIVQSLRNFSRLDEAEVKPVDLHEGIDSTLMILQNRLKARSDSPGIEVTKNYGSLPQVECHAGQLNQVFMNILINALDALEEHHANAASPEQPGQIWIQTSKLPNHWVEIRIRDNGPGISPAIQQRLFDPFFTTKPVGHGTGIGLSISYQIVTERHGGTLECISSPGQGAEFVIRIPQSPQFSK